ncbi:hypothetical protein [Saccharibacillus sp. JS10]|uniref:ORC-CDC6 family AAA ATPase n=1 Tax=Saccharibacillus sp. JS10 TaxID=2950552 RepID=UPI002109D79A|nr:hypothetical protein [Saccharibacillus sp. JS10]MCQ4088249.1 hypothetical protein [Saccharibacillus sp. JS10]
MTEFIYRTEEIKPEEIENFFVETKRDREIIEKLHSRSPVILVGSRGVGKSFLFKMANIGMSKNFKDKKVFPVYLTFRASSLIHTNDPMQFHNWMMSRICNELVRALSKSGLLTIVPSSLSVLAGGVYELDSPEKSNIESIAKSFEESWKNPDKDIDTRKLPTTDEFLDAIEDLCNDLDISRIVVFIDEAAHVFVPEQQRQFFTLFRDLRSPYISCNAAVYPGVTVYGDTFQPMHDASIINLHRDIMDDDYVGNMKEMVLKQISDSNIVSTISKRGENFSILAYAASGNPRHLLKTVSMSNNFDSNSINKVIREYYRTEIWSEHSKLAEKFQGHQPLIDWGRKFLESAVLPEIQSKNSHSLEESSKETSCFFWIHRNAPQSIKEALRLLEYTGVVKENSSGIKATRSQIGTRYSVNIGNLLSLESSPSTVALLVVKSLALGKMTEYGENHKEYSSLISELPSFEEPKMSDMLIHQLSKSVWFLDLTDWQKQTLISLNLLTIGDILRAPETKLLEAYQVGNVRARRMKNAAMSAVYEYLSG